MLWCPVATEDLIHKEMYNYFSSLIVSSKGFNPFRQNTTT